MRKRLNIDLDENPFIYIKIRSIFLYFFLAAILAVVPYIIILGTWSAIAGNETILENPDPIFELLAGIYISSIWFSFIVYRFRRVGIDWSRLIGKIPKNFNWLPILFLALIGLLFSLGMMRVTFYPISFLFPDWLQSTLINTDNIDAQNSFSPVMYYALSYLSDFTINPLSEILLFSIIFLYSFSCKYKKNKAILITCLIGSLLGYVYAIGIFIRIFITIVLYLKNKTLIIPLVFIIFSDFLYLIWNLLSNLFFSNDSINVLDNFQAQLPLGIFLVAISAPYLIYWLYQNRIKESDELPYFVNKTAS